MLPITRIYTGNSIASAEKTCCRLLYSNNQRNTHIKCPAVTHRLSTSQALYLVAATIQQKSRSRFVWTIYTTHVLTYQRARCVCNLRVRVRSCVWVFTVVCGNTECISASRFYVLLRSTAAASALSCHLCRVMPHYIPRGSYGTTFYACVYLEYASDVGTTIPKQVVNTLSCVLSGSSC